MTKKILFTIGSRANYGRLSSLISKFKCSTLFKVEIAVHSSAIVDKYGDISKVLQANGHSPNFVFDTLLHSDSTQGSSKTIALGISEFATLLAQSNPDFVVVGGDRYEILAPSIATMFHTAQLIHLQGGEVSGNIDDKVRNAVTKMSDIHFPATKEAHTRLIDQGAFPERTYNYGCPGMDLIFDSSYNDIDFGELNSSGVGKSLDKNYEFGLLILHPESFDENFNKKAMDLIFSSLEKIATVKNIIAFWPNADLDNGSMARSLRIIIDKNKYSNINIRVFKGFSPEKFINIISNCKFCIGNSSSFVREGALLAKPAILVGNRQQNRDIKNNIQITDVNNVEALEDSIIWASSITNIEPDYSYGRGDTSNKIYEAVLSIC